MKAIAMTVRASSSAISSAGQPGRETVPLQLGFSIKALVRCFVYQPVGRELEGDGVVELRVRGFVDDIHPTFTEFAVIL